MRNDVKYGAVILAGGRGERFHGQKQFYKLEGKALWERVYDKSVSALGTSDNVIRVGIDIPGGNTRTDSVRAGLLELDSDTDRILIAEAARPLVTVKQMEQLLSDSAPSSSFVMPLVNTIVKRDGTYINREEMYELLTPQAFDFKKLLAAYYTDKYENMTDETRIMYEEYGIKAHFIETEDNLIKITYPRDIAIAEQLIKERGDLL